MSKKKLPRFTSKKNSPSNGPKKALIKFLTSLYKRKKDLLNNTTDSHHFIKLKLTNIFDTGCEHLKEYDGADPWYPPASINYVLYEPTNLPPALNPIAQSLQESRCLINFNARRNLTRRIV